MATNYPSWATFAGHGCPVTGYYWGNESNGPKMDHAAEYEIIDQGSLLVIHKVIEKIGNPYPHRVTIPYDKEFWWSSNLPSVAWWGERNAARRRVIADEDERRAIEAAPVPPGEYIVDEDPWDALIGRQVTIRVQRRPTRELPSAPPFYKREAPRLYDPVRSADSRAHITARRETMPINHDAFRHPLQGKPKGQESEYAWLLGATYARVWGPGHILAMSYDETRAAVLRIEEVKILHGPSVHVITVNGQMFQWEMDQRKIMHIITSAQMENGGVATVYPEDAGAQPAPGQAEDNVVIRLECGHDVDLPEMPRARIRVTCSQDGPQYVTYWKGNEPMDPYRTDFRP